MSDQKLVSPLLDGFMMGDPISTHDGVRCCPAMKENSDDKYIVKIISIPASQKQLDALLLTGAFPDAAAATAYFKELSDGIVQEAETLEQLSRLEGFLGYDSWQVVPMEENNLGYEIYLLSPYKRSLDKHLRRNTMTHLGAVNLGLDLCAALSICRRAGYLFVDLKPGNVFISGEREYRIGDLGFANLKTLKYTSLPARYRSQYTPPELHDDLATLNPTADIYAVGMILYQIYNNGVLPFEDHAPLETLPSPLNADYEMAEIILKACDPNPRNRWQTPIEMGQALVSYMQRNTINDLPIVPPTADSLLTEEPEEEPAADNADAPEAEDIHEELSFMEKMVTDETAPDADAGDDLEAEQLTSEVTDMLAQADELLAAETPEGVVIREHIEPETEEPAEEPAAEEATAEPEDDDEDDSESEDVEFNPKNILNLRYDRDNSDHAPAGISHRRRKKGGLVTIVVLMLILALLGCGGYYYYQNYYLMHIDNMEISGFEDTITVMVSTEIDPSLLTVVCTDVYGNTYQSALTDGKAQFTDLTPATMYKITLEVSGFHGLTGVEPCNYTTTEQTKILNFTAKTGNDDGSVVLSFTVDGPEQDWMVEYTAEGEETKSISFNGHMVTITDLAIGKDYTFTLTPNADTELFLVGENSIGFTASKIVVAENLQIISCVDGVLEAAWEAPEDASVAGWIVRCYSENGYDETVNTAAKKAEFTGVSASDSYTVEVTAEGMSQSVRTYVSANPVTVTELELDESDPYSLSIDWSFAGTKPGSGWLLMYNVDGGEHEVVQTTETSAEITNLIPGSVYNLSIQAADGSSVFGGSYEYRVPAAEIFNDHFVDGDSIQASLCPTPDKQNWTYKDIKDDEYTATHAIGAKASMVLYSSERPEYATDEIIVMYVIRDSEGKALTQYTSLQTLHWNSMWPDRSRYCSLNIPQIPTVAGKYTISVYFNRCHIVTKNLTITE